MHRSPYQRLRYSGNNALSTAHSLFNFLHNNPYTPCCMELFHIDVVQGSLRADAQLSKSIET